MPTSDSLPRKTIVLLVVAAVVVVVVFIGGLAFGGSDSGGSADVRKRLDELVSPAPLPLADLSPHSDDCPVAEAFTFTLSCRYEVAPDESGPFGLGLARALTVTNTGAADVQLQLDLGGRLIPEDPGSVRDAELAPQESKDLTFGPDAAAFTMICTAPLPLECSIGFTADP